MGYEVVLLFLVVAFVIVVVAREFIERLPRDDHPPEHERVFRDARVLWQSGQSQPSPGSIWTERILLVRGDGRQHRYEVYDSAGRLLAYVVPESTKWLDDTTGQRLPTSTLCDASGQPLLKTSWSPTQGALEFRVRHPSGAEYGRIGLLKSHNRKIWLKIDGADGRRLGALRAHEDRAFSAFSFSIEDQQGHELVRIRRASERWDEVEDGVEVLAALSPELQPLVVAAVTQLVMLQSVSWIDT
jgi:hypothetical protein